MSLAGNAWQRPRLRQPLVTFNPVGCGCGSTIPEKIRDHGVAGSKGKKKLVIVESGTKAKKIGGYLGSNFDVRACVGHVRDLPNGAKDVPEELKKESWSNLGVNVESDFEPLYIVPNEKKKVVTDLKKALKDADELILATDEDREGESIGWHLLELLQPKVPVSRIVFSEVTKKAIQDALEHPRDLDLNLVKAQETRRVLDRLYGYRLSPLLWKKIKAGLSAGRVQSVAVRILVQRELERMAFKSGTYWDLEATLKLRNEPAFLVQLATVGGKRVASGKDFDENTGKIKEGTDVLLLDEAQAKELVTRLKSVSWTVTNIEEKSQSRRPPAPFTTSTLQQEAYRKLGLGNRDTMSVAQRLYEEGYITYMRTDSTNLSNEALQAARTRIEESYGNNYLPSEPRQYASHAKNAQEAHEAIRPAGTEMKTADELGLDGREARLYDMIWKRTMASQMTDARLRFTTVTLDADDTTFKGTGRTVEFAGYFRAYVEGTDDPEAALEDQQSPLPPLQVGDAPKCEHVDPIGHETKPPARYNQASLVRKLESEGVGRPSTYASIIQTIISRNYVNEVNKQLVPTFTAMAVTRLLEDFFPSLVDLQFTAEMEQWLDDISNGTGDRSAYLKKFYLGRNGLDDQVKDKEGSIDPREACTLRIDGLGPTVRVGKFGPYLERENGNGVETASLPNDINPDEITNELAEEMFRRKLQGPQSLGEHADTGLPIFVKVGPFGPYLQLGEVTDENEKPKRVSIPKDMDPDSITLETATQLLSLPRRLGQHPEDGKVVNAGIGRFGPYVQHAKTFKSLTKDDNVLTIGLDRAVELLKQANRKGATPIKELGEHPEDKEPVEVYEGRYGPYVKHGKINATIPKDRDPMTVSLEEAVVWLEERAAKGGGKRGGGRKFTKRASNPKSAKGKKTGGSAARKTPKRKSKKKPQDNDD
jgi:DNA topoisomerase-1